MKASHRSILLLPLALAWCSLVPGGAADAGQPSLAGVEERSSFIDRPGANAVLSREAANLPGSTEAHVANPGGLDARREAIIEALWHDNEAAFLELARSPSTGREGLTNQKFREISREWKRFRTERIRTLREDPVDPDIAKADTSVWCRHQWMTMPEEPRSRPVRGNVILIFDPADWSLRFVRIVRFDRPTYNVLPDPDPTISNDPVIDRPASSIT